MKGISILVALAVIGFANALPCDDLSAAIARGSYDLSFAVTATPHIAAGDQAWCAAYVPATPTTTPKPVSTITTSSGDYGSRFLAKGACYWHKSKNIIELGLDKPVGMQLPAATGLDFPRFREICFLYQTAWKQNALDGFLTQLKPYELTTGRQ
jgi:hypothetical protein